MNRGRLIFSQLFDFLPKREFQRCVAKYDGNKHCRTFSCWDQFLCLAFAQLTYRESLRDIETCLRAIGIKLYQLGIKGKVSRSTLADANNKRSWLIYYEFAQIVIQRAQKLYAVSGNDTEQQSFLSELKGAAYCLDASVIDLCLSLFPWAHYTNQGKGRAAIKLHTLLNLQTKIPSFFTVTSARTYELQVLDTLALEAGAFYVMDRGYFDWERLFRIHQSSAFFLIRSKNQIVLRRLYSRPVSADAKQASIRSDHVVVTASSRGRGHRKFPQQLRRIRYYDLEKHKSLVFLTNNFELQAETIAQLYKSRWQIELFFKWIKQHLRIKAFYGNTENAVKTQICIAVTVYVMIAIVRKTLRLPHTLYTVLQILSIVVIEKTPLKSAFAKDFYYPEQEQQEKQLILPIFK